MTTAPDISAHRLALVELALLEKADGHISRTHRMLHLAYDPTVMPDVLAARDLLEQAAAHVLAAMKAQAVVCDAVEKAR